MYLTPRRRSRTKPSAAWRGLFVALSLAGACRPSDWTRVEVGSGIICAERDGEAWECVGEHRTVDPWDPTPPSTTYLDVGTGEDGACGVRASDGGLECWGRVGLTPPAGVYTRVARDLLDDAGSCAVDAAGVIVCWKASDNDPTDLVVWEGTWLDVKIGAGNGIALGVGGVPDCFGWYFVDDCQLHRPEPEVVQIAASSWGICVIYEDGSFDCSYLDGRPLDDDEAQREYASLAAAAGFVCAVDTTDTLSCWGEAEHDGQTYSVVPPPGRFTAVAASGDTICAIEKSGGLVCWSATGGLNFPGLSDMARIWEE